MVQFASLVIDEKKVGEKQWFACDNILVYLNYSGGVKSLDEIWLKIPGYNGKNMYKQYQASKSCVKHRTNKYTNIYIWTRITSSMMVKCKHTWWSEFLMSSCIHSHDIDSFNLLVWRSRGLAHRHSPRWYMRIS
jgi:hypothetical protein